MIESRAFLRGKVLAVVACPGPFLSKVGFFLGRRPTMTSPSSKSLGKVALVGAGPGDPALITVRGTQCLAEADLVLYDYLTNPLLLDYAPATAERVSLGHPHGGRETIQQEVNQRMIAAAREGKRVVRLKSGDPHLFGRGAEEVQALVEAGIPFEVVPGVTAATAAASHAGIPITHRDLASAVALITGHRRGDACGAAINYQSLAHFPGTLVFYMGMTTSRQWSEALLRGGRSPETPVAIVRRASWPDQETITCTLGTVADVVERQAIRPPAVIIVGEVVALGPHKQKAASVGVPALAGDRTRSEKKRSRLKAGLQRAETCLSPHRPEAQVEGIVMAKRLILVRHAQVEAAHAGRLVGATDVPLDVAGQTQAGSLARRVMRLRPEACYCSPAQRCRQTAAALGSEVPVSVDPDLREIDFGEWENRTFAEAALADPAMVERWAAFDPDFSFPGGEQIGSFWFAFDRPRIGWSAWRHRPCSPSRTVAWSGR